MLTFSVKFCQGISRNTLNFLLNVIIGFFFQILSRMKKNHTFAEGSLELVTEEWYSDIIDIMANHFMNDEPLCAAFGAKMNPFFDGRLRLRLRENLSIMAVSNDTNEIMGVVICRVAKESDIFNLNKFDDDNMRAMYTFLAQKDSEIDLYQYGVSQIFHIPFLAVQRKYRNRGIASILFDSCMTLSKKLGFKASKIEGTSNFSQRIIENYGFKMILELPYDQYKYKDAYLSQRTGVHTSAKKYFLKF